MSLSKTAFLSGIIGAGGAGAILSVGSSLVAWPVSNFGGYALAQIILGGGPSISASIASLGGPLAVGGLLCLVAGLLSSAVSIFVWRFRNAFPF